MSQHAFSPDKACCGFIFFRRKIWLNDWLGPPRIKAACEQTLDFGSNSRQGGDFGREGPGGPPHPSLLLSRQIGGEFPLVRELHTRLPSSHPLQTADRHLSSYEFDLQCSPH